MSMLRFVVVIIVLSILAGCALQRQPDLDNAHDNVPTGESETLLNRAETCFNQADGAIRLNECRVQYESILKINPGDYAALTKLSSINILIGTAYTTSSTSKSRYFQLAMDYGEQAMFTSPEFRSLIEDGIPLWEAVEALGEAEVEAMFFWVTALQYEFKEGMSLPSKIINVSWLEHALVVLDHIEKVAPDFGGGGVEFAKAICYYALPERNGGSKQQGDRMMQVAVEENSDWLLPRWARAKYYYEITDQPEKKREELNWIIKQNPADFLDPYPWRMHFVENAAELLK